MNLESQIDNSLWKSIMNNYENKNYTGAILDTTHFLSNLIRDKTGLESDGVSLVGQAFGSISPKIKVNNLQTESEQNVQKGLEQILRGVYQAVRNPRSHEKIEDTVEDANAIIVFIDYLIKIINKSKTQFSEEEYIKRVFDCNFVKSARYAQLIVEEIPVRRRLEIAILIYIERASGDEESLKYFFNELIHLLKSEEIDELYSVVSEELKVIDSDEEIRSMIRILPSENWIKINEVARLRIENILIKSIEIGCYDKSNDSCNYGALGTWISRIIPYITLKDELHNICIEKLASSRKAEQDYIFYYFSHIINNMIVESNGYLISVIIDGLKQGDKRFYDILHSSFLPLDDENEWNKALIEEMDAFEEAIPF